MKYNAVVTITQAHMSPSVPNAAPVEDENFFHEEAERILDKKEERAHGVLLSNNHQRLEMKV
jgi:hypothetical protein